MKVIKDRKNDKRQKYETETNDSRDQGTIIKDLDDGQSEEADKDSNEKTSLRCAADKDVCCSIPQSCWWPKTKVIPLLPLPLPPSSAIAAHCLPLQQETLPFVVVSNPNPLTDGISESSFGKELFNIRCFICLAKKLYKFVFCIN